ncbi:MAG: hypothetical protein ABIG37_03385 [Nanoarchaeota archaeon]|nr:hypothetical protein [Nanoarchaeota archaeon]
MKLSHEDIMDNTKSCQYLGCVVKGRTELTREKMEHGQVVGICNKKFNGKNYDEAECCYGLNNEQPMWKCPRRIPFPRAKESQLETV